LAANFQDTNWNLIDRANAVTTEERRSALAELYETYWYPLYAFARRRGCDHEDAADLTQAFFVHVFEKHALNGLTPTHGRFRAFLLASFKNFQSDVRQRARAQKRGGHLTRVPWDPTAIESRYRVAAASNDDPERLFMRQRALNVIERARRRLRARYLETGRSREFEMLSPWLAPQEGEPSAAEFGRLLGRTAAAARVLLYRFRRRFGAALRAEVASAQENAEETDSELRFLLKVLGRPAHPVG
jgi:RNA polymerase sigma-70 factor (ECF subfamily)